MANKWKTAVQSATSLDQLRSLMGLPALPSTTPAQTYTAPDGKAFTDINAYNAYLDSSRRDAFTRNLASARSAAEMNARSSINSRGLDYGTYGPQVQAEIERILQGIPDLDANPAGYLNPNLADNVLSGLQQGQRNQYGQQVNSTFTPNYAQTRIADTALDSTINDIMNEQNTLVTDALDRGLKRGQLNAKGATAGQGALAKARTGVSAKLNQTENDILSGYRGRIDDVASGAAGAAGGFTLGGNFNLNDFVGRADNVVNDFNTNAAGQLINQVGSAPLIDLSSILGSAGQAQGAQNLNNLDVLEALERKKQTQAAGRGLGSQGAF